METRWRRPLTNSANSCFLSLPRTMNRHDCWLWADGALLAASSIVSRSLAATGRSRKRRTLRRSRIERSVSFRERSAELLKAHSPKVVVSGHRLNTDRNRQTYVKREIKLFCIRVSSVFNPWLLSCVAVFSVPYDWRSTYSFTAVQSCFQTLGRAAGVKSHVAPKTITESVPPAVSQKPGPKCSATIVAAPTSIRHAKNSH